MIMPMMTLMLLYNINVDVNPRLSRLDPYYYIDRNGELNSLPHGCGDDNWDEWDSQICPGDVMLIEESSFTWEEIEDVEYAIKQGN